MEHLLSLEREISGSLSQVTTYTLYSISQVHEQLSLFWVLDLVIPALLDLERGIRASRLAVVATSIIDVVIRNSGKEREKYILISPLSRFYLGIVSKDTWGARTRIRIITQSRNRTPCAKR